jgi:hypothetical protein
MLVHNVFFWLKEGHSKKDKESFISEVKMLAHIPDVESVYVGTPAAVNDRKVIDKSYDVALTVIFKDIASHDSYQTHEIHQRFLANNSSKWTRVLVYDAN